MKKKPTPTPPTPEPKKESDILMNRLLIIGSFWIILFIITIIWHSRTTARLIPIVGVIGVAYAAFVSYRLLKKNNKPK